MPTDLLQPSRLPLWLSPRLSLRVFCPLLVIAGALAYGPRVAELREWRAEPDRFVADGISALGADSYYWLRIARELRLGIWQASPIDPLRNWPDGVLRGDAPWISRTIARVADATGDDVYRAGAWFSVVTSCLFLFPLGLFAWRVGWPAAGLLGGLVGATTRVYSNRTSIVEIDTEAVNLLGLCGLALVFSALDPRQPQSRQWLWAAVCGASLGLFVAWYDRPQFWLVMLATFAACLLARGFAVSRAALLVSLFALCANPANGIDSAAEIAVYLSDYLEPSLARQWVDSQGPGPLEYASITNIISELRTDPLDQALRRVLRPAWLAMLGLAVFSLWAAWQWRSALPLAPIAALAGMGLLSAARFVMFVGPVVGFGLGVLLSVVVRAAMRQRGGAQRSDAIACLLVIAGFTVLQLTVAKRLPLSPVTPVELVRSLRSVVAQIPTGSLVATAWSSGYMLQDVLSVATLNDGLRPDPVVEHLRARAFTSGDPRELQRMLAYLARHDRASVTRRFRDSYADAREDLLAGDGKFAGDLFVLFTEDSEDGLRDEFRRGQWDFAAGRSLPANFLRLRCRREPPEWHCRTQLGESFSVHIDTGQMTPGKPLRKLVILRGGSVQREIDYERATGGVLQLVIAPSGASGAGYLMDRRVFESSWNQLYMLGRPDERYFEPVLSDFPTARLYRVRGCDEQRTPSACE